jgi:hypothetical protein
MQIPTISVADDHHHRIDRVAHQGWVGARAAEHHGQEQGGLDHRHAQREHERAEGLAHSMGHDLGVVDRHQDRRDERGGAEQPQDGTHADRDSDHEKGQGQRGHDPGPCRHVESHHIESGNSSTVSSNGSSWSP